MFRMESCPKTASTMRDMWPYATAGRADILVSLNLRHIANERAERRIGAVNLREGYGVLRVKTPEEVLAYED